MTDVLVIGGGVSGLLIARHLLGDRPATRVTVVDGRASPPDPTRSSVGESTSEGGAHYLAHTLGLQDHLDRAQIAKFGLRFMLARPRGTPFADRAEVGIFSLGRGYCELPFTGTRPPSWQLHRGRLEREVYDGLHHAGVELRWATRVIDVTPGEPHQVVLDGPDGRSALTARWVVDASGRGALEPWLGPLSPVDHGIRAAWGWVDGRVDPDGFSADPAYAARLPAGLRWRSTTHLVSEGAWVWLIPLGDGRTSVGVVCAHDTPCPSTPEGWMAWLDDREPECAASIRALGVPSTILAREVTSTRADTVISVDRLARTGDAAGFLDPLYSSAFDHMALVNTLIVPAITDDLDGRPVARRCRWANTLHGRVVAHFESVYVGAYALLGDPAVISAKIAWDNVIYFALVAPLLTSGQLADEQAFGRVADLARRGSVLQERMQGVLRAWARASPGGQATGLVDVGRSEHQLAPLGRLRSGVARTDLPGTLALGIAELEALAVAMLRQAAVSVGVPLPDGPLNPYAASLDPADRLSLTRGAGCREVPAELEAGLEPVWLSASGPDAGGRARPRG